MPMGEYKDWEDCIAKNQDKADPAAYCGQVKKQIEGSQKIAGCYDDIEHCVTSQIAMGKKLESATNVCMFLNKKAELWQGNLIFLTPEMDINILPLNQKIAWKAILTLWEKNNKSPEWTMEQIREKLNEFNEIPAK